jgi:murein L,D-transpeptidase YcbB/YkuD
MRARVLVPLLIVVLVVAAAGVVFARAYARVDNAIHAEPLRSLLADAPEWRGDVPLETELWEMATAFYDSRGDLPVWIDGNRPAPALEALIDQLERASEHGFDPNVYGTHELKTAVEESRRAIGGVRFDPDHVPALEVRATVAYLQYAADLLGWRRSPREVNRDWPAERNEDDLDARLERATRGPEEVSATLAELEPQHPQYQGLKRALAQVTDDEDAERIRMNMERWRWTTRDMGDRYVLVNIPAYQLQVVEGDAPVLAMRVIVGADDSQTPVFSDLMTYLVFSPYWNIPASILRDETLPRVRKDPEYLRRNRIEVLPAGRDADPLDPKSIDWDDEEQLKGLRFRQMPGPENALGLVKFIFPNHFAVYLHDTPGVELFERDERALSHGCVRVENPVALAEYVLRERPEWTRERIVQAMEADEEQTVRPKTPLPVHLGYWTAWVEPDGQTVRFFDDPYGIDAAHAGVRQAGPAVSARAAR